MSPGAPLHILGALGALVTAIGLGGCATFTPTRELHTPRYTLTLPELWQVKTTGLADGQPTTVIIGTFIAKPPPAPEGSPPAGPVRSYEPMQSEVEVRIYAWPESAVADEGAAVRTPAEHEAASRVARLLARDQSLQLRRHVLVPDRPQECGRPPRSYKLLGVEREPLDVASQPGWRAVIVGGKLPGALLGVVARVPHEPDLGLYCHNLGNLQAHLQMLLDGLVALPTPAHIPAAEPVESEPSLETKPTLEGF